MISKAARQEQAAINQRRQVLEQDQAAINLRQQVLEQDQAAINLRKEVLEEEQAAINLRQQLLEEDEPMAAAPKAAAPKAAGINPGQQEQDLLRQQASTCHLIKFFGEQPPKTKFADLTKIIRVLHSKQFSDKAKRLAEVVSSNKRLILLSWHDVVPWVFCSNCRRALGGLYFAWECIFCLRPCCCRCYDIGKWTCTECLSKKPWLREIGDNYKGPHSDAMEMLD